MKLAVVGVGLIGGSIGLAARQRLGATVAGFDPEPANLARALELGAIDSAAADVATAVHGAEVVFCAAPVGALPAVVTAALDATAEATVVTDVGSTKRELVDRARRERARGALHRRSPACRRRDGRCRERPRGAARGRALVPHADRPLERDPLRPAAADDRRSRRATAGDRRGDTRPGDGDRQPPAARDRQRAGARGRGWRSAASPSACRRSAPASATRPASPAPIRRSGATSSPAIATRSPMASTR